MTTDWVVPSSHPPGVAPETRSSLGLIVFVINAFRTTASGGVIGTIDREHLVIPVVLNRKTLPVPTKQTLGEERGILENTVFETFLRDLSN
ncbi:hypothetical protein [Planctomycetes bacterium K23_9]|uniref:hypothetical protein n=1 Tax=Stieleria marina TaxID=1930275 RepID=UPI0011A53919